MDEKQKQIEELRRQITQLKCDLTSEYSEIGDWKIIKQMEAAALGEDAPYTDEEIKAYSKLRAEARETINKLEAELAEIENPATEETNAEG